MTHKKAILCCVLAGGVAIAGTVALADAKFDSATIGGLRARAIGPAVMSGRIAALDAIMLDRLNIYAGAAGGGVWKSINGGTTFKPIFDKHIQAIGAITIDRSNPEVVWVGTGEPWTRNSVSVGDGIYKTTDGGDNWKRVGLEKTERISKILIDPKESDTVYVCVPGHLWDDNEERGVFKTTDGGKSWDKILYVDEKTGCGNMAMDPQEPSILYAGMWQFRRYPDFFKSGGPGSGFYKSTDGGENWRKITKGLPEGELGRIAIAVAPSRPSVVYATVESEKTGMYRSDDLGETWRWVGSTGSVEARPFYFSLIVVDPKDHNRVYKPATFTAVSNDGGETFSGLGMGNHADHHALWINPDDSNHLILGTDGGVYISNNRGVNWSFVASLPVSQFYQASYDMAEPYNVYGGLQDNGSWMAPSRTASGIQNKHWDNVGMGDGFHVHVDRRDPDIMYVEYQGGRIQRFDRSTGERKDIQPLPEKSGEKLRFNWNAPIHLSPNRPDTIYLGAQFLLRSRDRGEQWERISPDLTTNDPQKQRQIDSGGLTPDNSTAENHCSIFAIGESPLNENVIWAGTDDGNLQITRDGGRTWKNVVGNVPNLPDCTWVSYVEPSRHAEGTALVTFDGHRTGDRVPHVYMTTDYGETWVSLATDDISGHCHVVLQDPINPDLLFLGTEYGLYISVDRGHRWARFKETFPPVSVRYLAIHPREHDLIIATHGRGIYIIDDITPLRALTPGVLESDVALLPARPTIMRIPASVQEFPGDDQFVGGNPPSGAQIVYYLKKRHLFGDMKVEVLDGNGEVLATLPGGKRRGINRTSWNMRAKGPKVAPAASLVPQMYAFLGPQVPAGEYTVRLTKGSKAYEGKFEAVMDPRADYTTDDMAVQDETVMRLYRMMEQLTYLVDSLLDVQKQANQSRGRKPADPGARTPSHVLGADDQTSKSLGELVDALEAFRKTVVATRKGGFIAGENQLREKLGSLYGTVNGFEGRPTGSQMKYMTVLEGELSEAGARFDAILKEHLDDLNASLKAQGAEAINKMTHEAWRALQAKG